MTGFDAIREIFNLTLEDIANMLGITKQSVSEWGKNGKPIPKKRVKELSEKIGISEDYFVISEIDEIKKLEIQSQKLLYGIKGEITVMVDEIEEGEETSKLFFTPKNFDTDTRLSKIYQNQLHIGLLNNIQFLNDLFMEYEKIAYDEEQHRTDSLKLYCEIVDAFVDALISINVDYDELLKDLQKHNEDSSNKKS